MDNKTRKRNWLWMAIAVTIQFVFFIASQEALWIVALFAVASLCAWYLWYIMRFDWEYLLRHEAFSMAGFSHTLENNHAFARYLDPGMTISGKPVFIDTRRTPKTTKYLGRWTVFTDSETGARMFRDNSIIRNCWYSMM